jgi:MFS family permease
MSVEIENLIISLSVCFVLPMLATIPATIFLCRRRISRNKQISYGTLLAGAAIAPLVLAIIATCMEPDIWWSYEHKSAPEDFLVMFGFIAAMCILPALGVVVYYQKKFRPK